MWWLIFQLSCRYCGWNLFQGVSFHLIKIIKSLLQITHFRSWNTAEADVTVIRVFWNYSSASFYSDNRTTSASKCGKSEKIWQGWFLQKADRMGTSRSCCCWCQRCCQSTCNFVERLEYYNTLLSIIDHTEFLSACRKESIYFNQMLPKLCLIKE